MMFSPLSQKKKTITNAIMSLLKPAIKNGKKFQNPIPTKIGGPGLIFTYLKEYLTTKAELHPKKPIGPFLTDYSIYQSPPASGLRVTWLGHSTLFIEMDGKKILTDPVWSNRVSFSRFIGPKRFFAPPLSLAHLPSPDIIIISHDHYDHLDISTIRQLANTNARFYCSLGVGRYLLSCGVRNEYITEMNWMDEQQNEDLKITATPARHFSGRGLHNNFETLWSSFVLTTANHNIYYGADSGWWEGFKEIGTKFGPFDLDFLEIGAYGKGWPDIHMGPDNAMKAHLALNSKILMPIHWGTFALALHAWKEPVERLIELAAAQQVKLLLPAPGQPIDIKKDPEAYSNKWWKS
jgi:L-ascorbate metabolism protein UlaG (beta-lactamase superfamily)